MKDIENQKKKRIALASHNQRLAADPKVSVWVEASAGTGKTKVLSDRVLQLLLKGANPSKILCLTYTKAAAVEMNNRIADRLSKWAVEKRDDLEKELKNLLGIEFDFVSDAENIVGKARRLFAVLLDTPGGIKIQTIHSFCQEILKRFPLEAKISPYFEVMDDRVSKETMEAIKRDMLSGNISEKANEALKFLIENAGEYKFPLIMQSIADKRNLVEAYLNKYQSVEGLINKVAFFLGVDQNQTTESVMCEFWKNINEFKVKQIIEVLSQGNDKSVQKAICLAKAFENKNFDDVCRFFLTDERPRKDLLSAKIKQNNQDIVLGVADITQQLVCTLQQMKSVRLLLSTKAVLVLAVEMLKMYQLYKSRKSKLDYNDLIVITRNLLEMPNVANWVLYKLDGGIDNVLIDEAQDTSSEQWAIIKAITTDFFSGKGTKEKNPTIFVVGDRKQSIYSFQGADPAEFQKMYDYFSSVASEFRDVNMEVSFRSTAAVLDVVNKVFSCGKAVSGVVKNEQNIAHVPSRIGEGGRVELWPLVEADEDDNSDKIWLPPVERIDNMSSSAKLAKQIAENIKNKVERGGVLKSKGRPLRYGDFLILVQRRNAFVEEMVRACKNVGVQITGVDRIKLQDQIVVNDLISLAKFVLLPDDDLNLACLLKSPLLGLNDDDLFELCYNRGVDSVWERMQKDDRFVKQIAFLSELYELAKIVRPFDFFNYVLTKKQGRKQFVERLGPDCKDALDEFVNLTLEFERDNIPSMQLFVNWLQKDEVVVSRNLEQKDGDAVRLMTVHGSKGLQAPIVILPDTVRVKNIKQEAKWISNDDVILYPLAKEYYSEKCCGMIDDEKRLSLEEYHRLLYVALTRAEECLCICGYKKKSKPSEECWYEICKDAFAKIANDKSGMLVYEVDQEIIPDIKQQDGDKFVVTKTPYWVNENIEQEINLAKTLTPSHQEDDKIPFISPLFDGNNNFYNRGRVIHKILQFLPSVDIEKREILLRDFLNRHVTDFNENEKKKIEYEILQLLNNKQFAPLFSQESIAEVSLMGQVENNIISGQIDRLVVLDDKVLIVDYKTNRPAAESLEDVPEAYIKQMRAYKELVCHIYPNKIVETYILWTNKAKIMKIE